MRALVKKGLQHLLMVLFGLIVTVHAKSVPQVMIHDQRHLLSTE
ncbi:hypothetical protein OF387_03730 [Lentilactobacillus hilgardii]|nr:hypothetical protein [Lentilactobacillus hilgardii]